VQLLLERQLDAGEAVVVDPDAADQLPGEAPLRVDATRLLVGADARDLQLLDERALLERQLAREVDEALGAVAQLGVELVPRAAEERREPRRRAAGVPDDARVGVNRDRILRDRELDARCDR